MYDVNIPYVCQQKQKLNKITRDLGDSLIMLHIK